MLFVTTYILHTIKMQGRHNEGRIHIEEEMDI